MKTPTISHTTKTLLSHLTLAGAAALTASSANAQITVVPVNENVGFAPGDLTTLTLPVPGLFGTSFIRFSTRQASYVGSTLFRFRTILEHDKGSSSVLVDIRPGFGGASSRFLATASAGKTFNAIGTSSSFKGNVAFHSTVGNGVGASKTFTDQYLAFKFEDATHGGQIDYGWINASLTDNSYNDLTLHIDSFAYDTSGAKIETGQTTDVPEPCPAVALAAFGALTLGAAGVRRLKALQAAV
jgi:hypothetical protein